MGKLREHIRPWLFFALLLGIFFFSSFNVKAESLDLGGGRRSNYEITSATISGSDLYIKGWMFIDRHQTYTNKSNYSYKLVIGGNEYSEVGSNPVNMTNYFKVQGVDTWCTEASLPNYTNNKCNVRYDSVGFSFKVSLSDLKGSSYGVQLRMYDKNKVAHTHPIKFALTLPTTTVGDFQYRFNTSLSDARFTIQNTNVIVRRTPNATLNSAGWWGGGSGGVTTNGTPYANWLLGRTFTGVAETRIIDGVTWYRPSNLRFSWTTHSSGGTKWYAVPGTNTHTAWIPSTFISLGGSNFTISVNQRPTITANNVSYNINNWTPNTANILSGVSSLDREDGARTVAISSIVHSDGTNYTNNHAGMSNKLGNYTVTYTASDSQGFTASKTRVITLTNNAPTMSLTNISRQANTWGGDLWEGISRSDDGGITSSSVTQIRHSDGTIYTTAAQMKGKLGTYTVSYRVADRFGAAATGSRTITMTGTAPTLTVSNISRNIKDWGGNLWEGVSYSDSDGSVVGAYVDRIQHSDTSVVTTAAQMKAKAGTYTLTHRVVDNHGQTTTRTRTITLTNNAPTLNVTNISRNIKDWGGNLWEGVTYSDYEGSVVGAYVDRIVHSDGGVVTTAAQMKLKAGTYTLTHRVVDNHGASTTKTRTITLTNNAPVITSNPQNFTTILGKNPNGGAWTATDLYYGMTISDYEDSNNTGVAYNANHVLWKNMTTTIKNANNQTVSVATMGTTHGVYTVTYQTRDSHGLSSSVYTRTIRVNAPAVLTLKDFYVIEGIAFPSDNERTGIGYDKFYDDAAFPDKLTSVVYKAVAMDAEDGDISHNIRVTNIKAPNGSTVSAINPSVVGTYVVTYSITDAHGATVTGTRNIIMLPASTPVIEASDRYFYRGDDVTKEILLQKVVATDKYDGNIIDKVDIINFDRIDANTSGTYDITYTVTNSSNKTTTKTVTIHIIDTVLDDATTSYVRYISDEFSNPITDTCKSGEKDNNNGKHCTLDPNSQWHLDSDLRNVLTTSLQKTPSDESATYIWVFTSDDIAEVDSFNRIPNPNPTHDKPEVIRPFGIETSNEFIRLFESRRKK